VVTPKKKRLNVKVYLVNGASGGLTANSVDLVVAARSGEELDSLSSENLLR